MGIKNRISKIIKLTVFMLLATVISAMLISNKSFATELIRGVESQVDNYPLPRYITYEEYINDPFLLCTGHGIAMPGYSSTTVRSGSYSTHVTDQGKDTGKLTIEDLGNATCFSDGTLKDGLVDTTSKTYGYYTNATEHDATPAEAYVLAELDQNTPGNGIEFTITDEEYTGEVQEEAYVEVDGIKYYTVEYNSSYEATKYVAKKDDGKYYVAEANNTEGRGNYSAVQLAWWAVATTQEGSREPDNSLATEARAFEDYINTLSENGQFSIDTSNANMFNITYPVTMESDKAEVLYDSTTNKYKIGPFKVNYLRSIIKCGERPAADFSGITNSTLVGKYYKDGQETEEEIDREHYRFVYEHDHAAVREDNNNVDTDESYPYPYSDEEFFIELDYLEDLSALSSFKFDFHYMNGGGTYTVFHGTYMTIYWKVRTSYISTGSGTAFNNDSEIMLAKNQKDDVKVQKVSGGSSSQNLTWANKTYVEVSGGDSATVEMYSDGYVRGHDLSIEDYGQDYIIVRYDPDGFSFPSATTYSNLTAGCSFEDFGSSNDWTNIKIPRDYSNVTTTKLVSFSFKTNWVDIGYETYNVTIKVTFNNADNEYHAEKVWDNLSVKLTAETENTEIKMNENKYIFDKKGIIGNGVSAKVSSSKGTAKIESRSEEWISCGGKKVTLKKAEVSAYMEVTVEESGNSITARYSIGMEAPYVEDTELTVGDSQTVETYVHNVNLDSLGSTAVDAAANTGYFEGLETAFTVDPNAPFTRFIGDFTTSLNDGLVRITGANLSNDAGTVVITFKDNNDKSITLTINFDGSYQAQASEEETEDPNANENENENGDGDGSSDSGSGDGTSDGSGDSSTGDGSGGQTAVANDVIANSASTHKSQPQTTPGPNPEPGDDDDPEYDEDDTEATTGGAYLNDNDANIEFLPDELDIDLTTAIGGMVWEDFETFEKGEEVKANGIYNDAEGDKKLSKIEVRIWKVVYEKKDSTYEEVMSGDYVRTLADAYRKKTVSENGSVKLEDKIDFESDDKNKRLFTDDNGDYKVYLNVPAIQGLDTEKYKVSYDVEFIYDGQTYEVTEYLASTGETETDKKVEKFESTSATPDGAGEDPNTVDYSAYANDSYAIETYNERYSFDTKFTEIYGKDDIQTDGTTKGEASNGNSDKLELNYTSQDQGFDTDPTGEADSQNDTDNKETRKVSSLVTKDNDGYVLDQYGMKARTSTAGLLLPYEDRIHVEDKKEDIPLEYIDTGAEGQFTYYKPINEYFGHINLGLVNRDKVDVSVSQDLYKAGITVNQDDLTYKYSALIDLEDEDYANKLNMLLDMQNAGVAYEIGLYASDFYYRSDVYKASGETEITKAIYEAKKESELRLFATYKMSVYNDSDYHDISVNELTDYFDSTYSLIEKEVSTEIENEEGVREKQIVAEPSYFRIYSPLGSDMIDSPYHYNKEEDMGEDLVRVNRTEDESEPMVTGEVTWNVDKGFSQEITAEDGTVGGTYSKMTTNTFETTTTDGGKRVTNELTLRPGEKLEIFVSFEVDHDGYNLATSEKSDETQEKKDETRQDLLGDKNSILEVSNFTSFYTEDSLRKNNNVAYKAGEVSGRVDKDSAPDNVNFSMTETLEKNGINYTILDKSWFEDDTDSAPVFRVYLRDKDQREREINGVVWEEDLNQKVEGVDNTNTGDGIFSDEEGRVPGVTVSLVEKIKLTDEEGKLEDGTAIPGGEYEYVWPDKAFGDAIPDYTSITMSNEKGEYTLRNFVSGNYVVRFEYGNTALTMDYNGQDYKNTSYQEGIVNPSQDTVDENFDEDHRNNDQTDSDLTEQITLNNEWHDLTGTTEGLTNSKEEKRVSDARDYEARRLGIIEFSRTIDNATAEVLAIADSKELQDLKAALSEKMFDENGNIIKNYGDALDEVLKENDTLKEFINGKSGEQSKYKALLEYTAMEANTSKLRVQIEDSSDLDFGTTKKSTGGAFTVNVGGSYDQILDAANHSNDTVEKAYTIANIDFGLERRADTIIQVDKFLKGIELQKENEPIYKLVLTDDGVIDTEKSIENPNLSLLSLIDSRGIQGFRYITISEDELRNTRLIIDYKVKVSNKSEVDYASSTIVNDAYTTEELNKHIASANDALQSGENIKYGKYAGLYYYTHDTEAADAEKTVAGATYTDEAVRTTIDQLVDYIDPGTALSAVSDENAFWSTVDNTGSEGSKYASLNGLISDDSYTYLDGENPKYYLQDDTGELYINESKSSIALSNNDALVKTQKTTPALDRGDKGEGQLTYKLNSGDSKANNIGQRSLQEQPVTVYNVYSYPNTFNTEYKPDVFNKDLTKELSTMNLVKDSNEETPTSAEINIRTQTDIQNEFDLDDMIYDNLAEVLAYSNSVGRRSMYAIPGNAFEIVKIEELDSTDGATGGGIWNAGHSSNPAKKPVSDIILEGLVSSIEDKEYDYMQKTKYAFNTIKAIETNKSADNNYNVAELDADAADFVTFTEPTGLSKAMENQTVFIIAMLVALIVLAVGIILITLKVVMVKSTDDITIESTKE